MNAIAISNVAIRQTENNLYNLNDLHKASGGEKRHELTNWLKLQQTTELIDELSKPEIPGLEEINKLSKLLKAATNAALTPAKNWFMPMPLGLVQNFSCWLSAPLTLLFQAPNPNLPKPPLPTAPRCAKPFPLWLANAILTTRPPTTWCISVSAWNPSKRLPPISCPMPSPISMP